MSHSELLQLPTHFESKERNLTLLANEEAHNFLRGQQANRKSRKQLFQINWPLIGHVRYINILTWLRGFRVKLLYLVLFSLYSSLFWELRDKRNLKKLTILTRKPRSHVRILIYRTWPINLWNKQTVLRRNFFPRKASNNSSWVKSKKTDEENKVRYKCFLRVHRVSGRSWLMTFVPIVSAHPYSVVRKFTCHVMHRECAPSTKMKNDRADGHCYSFAWI